MCNVIPSAQAAPVIVEEEYSGSWTDTFNDFSGVEDSDNITIENDNVVLSIDSGSDPITWDYEYTADTTPDAVGWSISENAAGVLASASGGLLTLDTTPEDAYWWYNYNWGASNTIGATFESRMKVIYNNQISIVNWLRDGTYYEGIKFYTNRIEMHIDTFNKYYMDTTDDFHVYRFTLKNNDYMVYVDGVLVINGTGQFTTPVGSNMCQFGDTNDLAGAASISVWDYCRYNVSGAFSPSSGAYYTNGNLTSTEIFLPGGMSWDTVNIDKTEPGDANFVNITVLNGVTFTPIPGFENLDNTEIDISSIDPIAYPSIRLYATLVGNVTSTPVLHDWQVTWYDITPPAIPSGLKVSNPLNGYSLVLNWDSNSEPDLDRYMLYSSTDNSTFIWLANVSANSVSFTHYGLSIGTYYFYKIAAADGVPNQSPFSDVVEGAPDLDYDHDGIGNIVDPDDDNDGIADVDDPYPYSDINDMEVTLDNLTIDIETLRTWLEAVIANVDANINATNNTLHQQLAIQDALMTSFYNSLTVDIGDISSDLQLHDQNTGQDHTDIIALLNDVLDGQIEKEKIAELRTMLMDLAGNLSEHDQSIANNIMDVIDDIDEFEVETGTQLERINKTLEDLDKLEQILSDLVALDQSLEQAEEDIQDSIDERSTKEEDEDRFFVLELLLIIVFVLLMVNMILTVLMGKRKKGEGPSVPPQPPIVEQPHKPLPPAPLSGDMGSAPGETSPPE